MKEINVYCDESCHLENDDNNVMVMGSISLEKEAVQAINKRIKEIKIKHNVYKYAELKWTKVSKSKIEMYKEIVDLFFEYDDILFRAVIATGKQELSLSKFSITYDDWYYRIYYLLLKNIISIDYRYSIFLDIKDTNGSVKVEKLKSVLNRTLYDFYESTVHNIQLVRSDQIEIMGLTDLFIGAISYKNRGLCSNEAKVELIKYIESKANVRLNLSTTKAERKFNIFKWSPRHV